MGGDVEGLGPGEGGIRGMTRGGRGGRLGVRHGPIFHFLKIDWGG